MALRITHILEATIGGTARHLVDVGGGLAAAGFAVEAVVSLRRTEAFREQARQLAAAGVSLVEVPMAREVAPTADIAALWRMARHLRRGRPHVVHTHSSKAGILGRAAAALAGVPVIVHTPHAFAFQMRTGRAQRALYLALERWAARRTTCLVAVSHAEAARAAAAGYSPTRVAVIDTGDTPAAALCPAEGAALRRELGIDAAAPLVLFAGRLVAQKAPEVLVRAAVAVLQSMPDAVFLLAGEGPLRPALEEEIRRAGRDTSIRLLGHREDVPRLLAGANAFALPSRWEGFPYALLEAMNAGLPVVGADIPPLREVVRPGENGTLVPPDDAGALAAALCDLLGNPERAGGLGAAGRALVRARYTRQRQVEELGNLYTRLVGHASGECSGWQRTDRPS